MDFDQRSINTGVVQLLMKTLSSIPNISRRYLCPMVLDGSVVWLAQ